MIKHHLVGRKMIRYYPKEERWSRWLGIILKKKYDQILFQLMIKNHPLIKWWSRILWLVRWWSSIIWSRYHPSSIVQSI